MAALASKRPQMPAPVGQGASGIRGSVLSHGGRSFVFEAVNETNPLTTLAPAFLLSARDQCERTWPGDQGAHQTPPKNPYTVARPPLSLTTMPGQQIIRVVAAIGLAVFASTLAFAVDVRRMTCAEIAAFAQEVAQQKA